ncbi:lipocalin family protein [Flavobacterium sp. FlaQc-50]|uniref:lipocalin family protein n=1 Tax=unclassified Flavobacterium TaxID=196869 RepID=UPI00375824F9
MKKVLLVLVLFGTLSCSSDDNKKEDSLSIVGNWKYVSANTYGVEQELTKCEKSLSYIELKTGTEVVEKSGLADVSSESGCKQTALTGTYAINDADQELIVTIYQDGKVFTKKNYFITELTNANLKLKIFKTSYFNSQSVWVEESLPEIKRTVYTYSK